MATILNCGRVIYGSDKTPADNLSIVIENGRIQEINPGFREAHSADEIIDAKGLTVLPGLIDSHLHMCLPVRASHRTARTFVKSERTAARAAIHGMNNALRLLSAG